MKLAGVEPEGQPWYPDLGQSIGATLNLAAALNAYALTDRAAWANFKNRQNLEILTEGDPFLSNTLGSILMNPAKWPQVNFKDALDMARVAHVEGWCCCNNIMSNQR